MKFLIDAQLPRDIAWILKNKGFDAIHTDDLPDKEKTTDNQIREISVKENRIVISKDSDFIDSYFVKRIPPRLIIITTGNIRNKELFLLFSKNIDQIIDLLDSCNLIDSSFGVEITHIKAPNGA
jgi:predicted nuclease of predicted toxin-antitoxin system